MNKMCQPTNHTKKQTNKKKNLVKEGVKHNSIMYYMTYETSRLLKLNNNNNKKKISQKVFNPLFIWLLMHHVSFWSISECLQLFNSCVWVPQCEKMDLKIIQSLLKMVQICKRCWKIQEFAGPGGFFWRTELGLTAQNKQGTHAQPSQNKQPVVDYPGNHTQY